MLVCAFASTTIDVLAAYRHAVAARYRFFSYGDAMLVHRHTFMIYDLPTPGFSFELLATLRAHAPASAAHAAAFIPDARVPCPVGTLPDARQGDDCCDGSYAPIRSAGINPGQHVSSLSSARSRGDGRRQRIQVRRLGSPDPHRLGRFSGVLLPRSGLATASRVSIAHRRANISSPGIDAHQSSDRTSLTAPINVRRDAATDAVHVALKAAWARTLPAPHHG